METSLIFQYAIIGILVLTVIYFSVKKFIKTFTKKKDGNGCDSDCGCS